MADNHKFEVGQLVKLSAEAARMFPRLYRVKGKVETISRDGLPKVKFEGRAVINAWHPSMLSTFKEPGNG